MGGCFGNHPIDRWMENQLFRYLDSCEDYETLCELICQKIPEEIWDKYEKKIDKLIDIFTEKVQKGLMTIEQAQATLANFCIMMVKTNKWRN